MLKKNPDEELTIGLCYVLRLQHKGMACWPIVGPILMSLDCPIKRLKRLSDCVYIPLRLGRKHWRIRNGMSLESNSTLPRADLRTCCLYSFMNEPMVGLVQLHLIFHSRSRRKHLPKTLFQRTSLHFQLESRRLCSCSHKKCSRVDVDVDHRKRKSNTSGCLPGELLDAENQPEI